MHSLEDYLHDVEYALCVEPSFPIPVKSRNHHEFLPVGLLKLAGYLRKMGVHVRLERYDGRQYNTLLTEEQEEYTPQLILVTSLFTYWSKYVKEAVQYYRMRYPDAKILVGGIYASLLPAHCKKYTGCDDVITGIVTGAEQVRPAYDLVDVDYQILHTSRGCVRRCGFCGTYTIEPEWQCKKSIKDEIFKKKIIFYDNNLLANRYIEDILHELITLREQKKVTYVESQSGLDGRILQTRPHLAELLYKAGFKNPKIAWDHHITDKDDIHEQLQLLFDAGYNPKTCSVFILYNYDIGYNECEMKRAKCFEYGVQVMDCRYRPLTSTTDGYNPHRKHQQRSEYYIHDNWTDDEVRMFRRNCRRHNICIRTGSEFHSSLVERKKLPRRVLRRIKDMTYDEAKNMIEDVWNPRTPHTSNEEQEEKICINCTTRTTEKSYKKWGGGATRHNHSHRPTLQHRLPVQHIQ